MSSQDVDNLWSQLRSALASIKWNWRARFYRLPVERRAIRVNIRIHAARIRKLRKQLGEIGALA